MQTSEFAPQILQAIESLTPLGSGMRSRLNSPTARYLVAACQTG